MRRKLCPPVVLMILLMANIALADGGLVRLSEATDDLEITVFTSPTPLTAGLVDISVLAADAKTKAVLADVRIEIIARRRDLPGPPLTSEATRELATNKLLRAAQFDLPQPGWWRFDVYVQRAHNPVQHVAFEAEVSPPPPRWITFWPWFTWPLAAVLLFGAHQWLVSRAKP